MTSKTLVDPAFFRRLDNLELRARGIVEGFLHGLQRSPFVGFSVEFASHREYAQGDDLRHVNWKLYARTKRLYVKEFDAETNMNLQMLVDISGSMECANTGRSKLSFGTTLAAALAHLALKQHDAVGLTLFADEVVAHLDPRAKPHQLDEILAAIANTKARPKSDASRARPIVLAARTSTAGLRSRSDSARPSANSAGGRGARGQRSEQQSPGVAQFERYAEIINTSPRESDTDRCSRQEFEDRFAVMLLEGFVGNRTTA